MLGEVVGGVGEGDDFFEFVEDAGDGGDGEFVEGGFVAEEFVVEEVLGDGGAALGEETGRGQECQGEKERGLFHWGQPVTGRGGGRLKRIRGVEGVFFRVEDGGFRREVILR